MKISLMRNGTDSQATRKCPDDGLVQERFASISDVIKISESMPERKAALVAARQKIAKMREDSGQQG